uniref:Ig-like domain-containing protein n=1 Tax=Periophthalmus magnuspinnatus TaxID=409849 RepID=A0A3B4AEW7_9GOBI
MHFTPTGTCHGAGVITFDLLRVPTTETVTFTTSVQPTGTPFLAVTWSFNGITNIITSTDIDVVGSGYENRITLDKTTGSLMLGNLTEKDSGKYELIIITQTGLQHHGTAELKVLKPVSNTLLISNVTEMWEFNSSAVQMSCSASGSSLSFMWFNGSSEITTSSRVQLTNGNTTLTLISVNRFDQGPFTCHAFNPVSSQSSDPISLTIIFGPEKINLTISPLQEHYDEGADVSLLCLTASGPPAFIQWFVNGGLLPHTGAELRLVNLQISQSGIYSCQAYNNRTMKNETYPIYTCPHNGPCHCNHIIK